MRLLVITLAGIGDTLLCTPFIHELRANFPNAKIDALVLWAGSRDLLETNPHLNQLWQRNLISGPKFASLRFLFSLRSQRYDVSINTHPQSRIHYRWVARIVGAPRRLSHTYDGSNWLDRQLATEAFPQDYSRHTVVQNLDFLSSLGGQVRLPSHPMEVFLSWDDEEWAENFVQQNHLVEAQTLGIHAGSGGTKNLMLKRWPLDSYERLVPSLAASRPDLSILLFGGPNEEEDHAKIVAAAHSSQKVLCVRAPNLRKAAALMKRCGVFLSVDTALMHLAAAMKVREQIVIEAPTLNATNLPYGNRYTLVPNSAIGGRNLEYYKYDGKGIQGTDNELRRLMSSVSVEAVAAAVMAALQRIA